MPAPIFPACSRRNNFEYSAHTRRECGRLPGKYGAAAHQVSFRNDRANSSIAVHSIQISLLFAIFLPETNAFGHLFLSGSFFPVDTFLSMLMTR